MPPAIAVRYRPVAVGPTSHESTSAPPYFGFATRNRTFEAQLALVPLQFHATELTIYADCPTAAAPLLVDWEL
jgi:hypothetical protein